MAPSIILKMSINNRELGGYACYFTNRNSVNLGRRYYIELNDYPAWAVCVMSLRKFKQIWALFHPEIRTSKFGTNVINNNMFWIPSIKLLKGYSSLAWIWVLMRVGWHLGQGLVLFISITRISFRISCWLFCIVQQLTWSVFHTALWCISRKECGEHWHTRWDNKIANYTESCGELYHTEQVGKWPKWISSPLHG